MYKDVESMVHSEQFVIKVGVHQGFIIYCSLCQLKNCSQELFYTDDLVLIAASMENLLVSWKYQVCVTQYNVVYIMSY